MNILFLLLQGFLGIAFTASGVLKIIPGNTAPKQNFSKMHLPAWWLGPIGILEVTTGLCILAGFFIPMFLLLGAVLAVCIMASAVLAHLIKDEKYEGYPALILLVVSGLILWGNWEKVTSLFS